ncbi:hypothetical protein [Parvibaculum sp.]|uniref:hypothetical protein n=1 Tax=Parvibaculum sp. TaxID=2024848 RepID=UPI00272FA5DB|nr:hypothetical protein [Parvibaculum sp.]MDP1628821.1 hypothetical protein [Parvibaculum sp.]MDP2148216.1 hypothetical protein [Parvibaculum sp.]MDP3327722.1 hypothetical protein [Parvibaculum sp.]
MSATQERERTIGMDNHSARAGALAATLEDVTRIMESVLRHPKGLRFDIDRKDLQEAVERNRKLLREIEEIDAASFARICAASKGRLA